MITNGTNCCFRILILTSCTKLILPLRAGFVVIFNTEQNPKAALTKPPGNVNLLTTCLIPNSYFVTVSSKRLTNLFYNSRYLQSIAIMSLPCSKRTHSNNLFVYYYRVYSRLNLSVICNFYCLLITLIVLPPRSP